MNYLLDKKTKRNKILFIVFSLAVLFFLVYFRAPIFHRLSVISHVIFRPFLSLGNNVGDKFEGTGSFFKSKKSLFLENENLKRELMEIQARLANHNSIVDENNQIKEILGRKNETTPMILSSILSRPNQSLYDTLIIDAGTNQDVVEGDLVFAFGNIPIGRVTLVYPNSSKIILFSNPGESTEVLVPLGSSPTGEAGGDVSMELVGRGGGNFEMILLRDFDLPLGTEVVLPGITPRVIGVVETIISDPRDAFQKALLVSPVNVRELKFVQIAK